MTYKKCKALAARLTAELGVPVDWVDQQFTINGVTNTASRLLTMGITTLEILRKDKEWSADTAVNIQETSVFLGMTKGNKEFFEYKLDV